MANKFEFDNEIYDIDNIVDLWKLGKKLLQCKTRHNVLPVPRFTLAINLARKITNYRTLKGCNFSPSTWRFLSKVYGKTFISLLKEIKEKFKEDRDCVRKILLRYPTLMQLSIQDVLKALIVNLEAFLDSFPMIERMVISPEVTKDAKRLFELFREVEDKLYVLLSKTSKTDNKPDEKAPRKNSRKIQVS
jgi:hypothetical protein